MDVIALINAFKRCTIREYIILPDLISLEDIDKEDSILNIDRVKVIKPMKRILLLIQFILEWNKENNDNFPIDLTCSLLSLLDEIRYTQVIDYYQVDKRLKKTESFINLLIKTWNVTLSNLGMVDIPEYKTNYINNMIASMRRDQNIIFVGIGKNSIHKLLIKAIYDLPLGKVILPNLNLEIREECWKFLNKKHYQYCLKDLLDYLGVDRRNVICLNTTNSNIDCIFDTTVDLSKINDGECIKNIEIIVCNSREEEAQMTSLIMEGEDYENISLYIFDKLLASRMRCSSLKNHSYVTLLLYSVEVLSSNWNSVALLSLLKHKLVTFGYIEKNYIQILSEFEIEILRNFSINGSSSIINIINVHKKLKYKEDILIIINKLKVIFDLLLNSVNCPISHVIATHLQCISLLSGIDFSELDNEIGIFIRALLSACEGIMIKCSLKLYVQILTFLLKREFFSTVDSLNRFNLYYNKVIILAGFYDIPSFQNPFLNTLTRERFGFPSIQEEQGYFLYNLHGLFGASKVYIISLLSNRKSILLRRLEIVLRKESKYSHNWLKMLNTPEVIAPCARPVPKPKSEVRKEIMQVMSCSAVEKLIRNPYSFYAEYILNIKKLRDLNFKPSMLEFGVIVHSTLEKYLHSRESPMRIAQEVFSSSQFTFSNMWLVRLQKIVQSFIKFNRTTRSNRFELEKVFFYPIFHLDTEVYTSHNNLSKYKITCTENIDLVAKGILLTSKCDRVEYLPNGKIAIIDYKLGSIPSDEEITSGFFSQLILEALTVEHTTKMEVSELIYWKLDFNEIKVFSLKNCRQKILEFKSGLPKFLFSYLKDSIPFIASPYFNRFLDFYVYKQLERTGEWL
ncbi:MAG: PD-(D/E)XK nuclease family protein [Wolbachia endosymbiont of Menacanthus eurysternus]|nr:MAG: PD-(D/E)XK nuclease family protein [Wolbachia endosymbiont of Menacanthus eurysternus]